MSQACASPSSAQSNSKKPNALPPSYPFHMPLQQINAMFNRQKQFYNNKLDRDENMQAIYDILQSVNSGNPQPLTAAQQALIKKEAKFLYEQLDKADDLVVEQQAALKEIYDVAENATEGTVSWYFKLTNYIARTFSDTGAAIDGVFVKYFGTDGARVSDNQLVAARHNMQASYHGIRQILERFREKNVDPVVAELAAKTGYDPVNIYAIAGEYMAMMHMPEGNKHLIENVWRKPLDEEIAWLEQNAGNPNDVLYQRHYERAADLAHKIDELVKNLDNPNPPPNLYCRGRTNAQAKAQMDTILSTLGVTHDDMMKVIDAFQEFRREVVRLRVENGTLTRDEIEALPEEFSVYVPIRTAADDNMSALTDADVYDSGKYKSISGTRASSELENGWISLLNYSTKAAKEISVKQFGDVAIQSIRAADAQGRKTPLQMIDYDEVLSALNSRDPAVRNIAHSLISNAKGGGGIVVKGVDPTNMTATKRYYITFDRNFVDADLNVTGLKLNELMAESLKNETPVPKLAKATGFMGQLFTRFQPTFGAINSMRDVQERAAHMASRDYVLEDGSRVSGASLLGSYISNTVRAQSILRKALTGQLQEGTAEYALWRAYERAGLHQQYTLGMTKERVSIQDALDNKVRNISKIEDALKQKGYSEVSKALNKLGDKRREALRYIDGWNDYFNNVAPLSQFITLKEAGVRTRAVTEGVLELMNLYTTGGAVPVLSAMYPFVKPTVQSGVAMARSLGLAPNARGKFEVNKRGVAALTGLFAAYSALIPILKDSMGYDEEGNSRFDTLSMSSLQSALPIAYDDQGSHLRYFIGFGFPAIAITAAVGLDRVNRGLMNPADFISEMVFSVGKNVMPGNMPAYNMSVDPFAWILQAFSPTLLSPVTSVAVNRDHFGRQISYADDSSFRSKADQGQPKTEQFYHDLAKDIRDMLGFDGASPEQYKAIMRGYFAGITSMVTNVAEAGSAKTHTMVKSMREELGPFWSAVGLGSLVGRPADMEQSLFYQALEKYKSMTRVAGVKLRADEKSDTANYLKKKEELLNAGFSEDDVEDTLLLIEAESKLRRMGAEFKKQLEPAFQSADSLDDLAPLYDTYAEQRNQIFKNVLKNLRWYQRAR